MLNSSFCYFVLLAGLLCSGLYTKRCVAEQYISQEGDQSRFAVKRIVITGSGNSDGSGIDFRVLNKRAAELLKPYTGLMSVDELYQIADELTLIVRNQGYLFHTVFLAPQRVNGSTVRFTYIEARLRDVNVINHSKLSSALIREPFAQLDAKALIASEIERRVNALKALPGISVFAFYSKADDNNGIRLNLRVEDKSTSQFSLRLENYGTESAGKNRLIPSYNVSNVLRSFDAFSLALLATQGEGDTVHGYASYQLPLFSIDSFLRVSGGDTHYALGDELSALELKGDARVLSASLGKIFARSASRHSELTLSYNVKTSELNSNFDSSLENIEDSRYTQLTFLDRYTGDRISSRIELAYGQGEFESKQMAATQSTQAPFESAVLDYGFYASWRALTKKTWGLMIKGQVRGQYSDSQLPGINKVSLGGAYGVRAVAPGRHSADSGWISSIELALPFIIGSSVVKPYVFWDTAKAESYVFNAPENEQISLSGTGLGLGITWHKFTFNAAYAQAQTERIQLSDSIEEVDGDAQVLLEIRWQP